MSETVDLYNNVYGDFGSRAEAAVPQDAFGEDIGQSSWLTATEWLRFADQVQVREHSHVLEVGSGSGGPAVYLAAARGCHVTGVDINEHGVRNAERLAVARGVADRVTFRNGGREQAASIPGRQIRRGSFERCDVPHLKSLGGSQRMAPRVAAARAHSVHGRNGRHGSGVTGGTGRP